MTKPERTALVIAFIIIIIFFISIIVASIVASMKLSANNAFMAYM